MPKIETFNAGMRAFSPDSMGSSAFEMEGRHTEAAYAQAGGAIGGGMKVLGRDIQEHQEIQDSSAISAAGAKAFADLSQSLSTTMNGADPNDADAVGDKWRQQAESVIGNIGADAQTSHGKEMAARAQATLRNEFTKQSLAYQSTLGGQAVQQNLEQTKNGLAQAVSNNPSMLPTALSYLHGTMEDQIKAHSSLNSEEIARIRSEVGNSAAKDLGIAAFQTMAQRNPEAAKAALSGGTFAGMFSGEEIGSLNRYADAQVKAIDSASKAAEAEQRRQDNDAFRTSMAQTIGQFIQPDGSLRVPTDAPQKLVAMSLMPGANPGEIKSAADMIKTIQKGDRGHTDPSTYQLFSKKLIDGSLQSQDLYQARADGNITDKDVSYFTRGMHNLAADPAKKDAMKQFNQWVLAQKPAFTKPGLLGVQDPQGAIRFNQFQQEAQGMFEQVYDSKGDWKSMLNAQNPNYLGKLAPNFMQNTKGATVAPPHVSSIEEANKLKPGTMFIDPNGVPRVR